MAEAAVCADVAVALGVALGVDELDARAEPEEDACADPEEDACAEPDADALALLLAADELRDVLDDWPVDGVRVPEPLAAEDPPICGVDVKTDGIDEPPAVQAETVSARSTAPAAERPAIGHASRAATAGIRRIFMYPPRMRVR